jgi:hypothetical protein
MYFDKNNYQKRDTFKKIFDFKNNSIHDIFFFI